MGGAEAADRRAEIEAIARALGGRRVGAGWLCHCPAHDDRRPSLSLGVGDGGRLLVHCFAGCTFRAVAAALAGLGLGGASTWAAARGDDRGRELLRLEEARREAARAARAAGIWAASRRIVPGDPVDRYLRGRGLMSADKAWPVCLRAGRDDGGPVLVAAAQRWPDPTIVAVQLTRLTSDGRKRPCGLPRLTYGVARGAAVWVVPWRPDARGIVLVEGVEDALAVAAVSSDAAVAACLGAAGAAAVRLPARARVVLALDGDDAGRQAAAAAARALRLRGHAVAIAALPGGVDPADLVVEKKCPTLWRRA